MAFSFLHENEVIVTRSGRTRYEIRLLTCSQLDLLLQREETPSAQLSHRGAAGYNGELDLTLMRL